MIGSIRNTALAGIQNGLDNLQKNARQIAGDPTAPDADAQSLVEAVVDLKANVQQVEASMKVLKVSDDIIGTLLDIKT